MCTVCGCGDGETRIESAANDHHHHHDRGHGHSHAHGAALRDDPVDRSATLIKVEKDILSRNDSIAARNRQHFAAHNLLALNLVSSPGAGKTTLLCALLEKLKGRLPAAVIEGDQETTADADRIRATGAPAIQVNTGRGCHLDAEMVEKAYAQLHTADGVLFIENVGNLVCPAGFDLGESDKIVIASVTEGEDKPLKYPNMFAASSLMVVSKIDLVPHLDFDVDALIANAKRVNPNIGVIRVSTKSGEGLEKLLAWIDASRARLAAAAE